MPGFFTVAVAERAIGEAVIAQPLLQLRRIGEAAVNFAIPNHHAIDADLIDPAGARHQGDGGEIVAEGIEQLLRHPAGAQ